MKILKGKGTGPTPKSPTLLIHFYRPDNMAFDAFFYPVDFRQSVGETFQLIRKAPTRTLLGPEPRQKAAHRQAEQDTANPPGKNNALEVKARPKGLQ